MEDLLEYFFVGGGDGGEHEVAGFLSPQFVRLADADADTRKVFGVEMVDDGTNPVVPGGTPARHVLEFPNGNIAVVVDDDDILRGRAEDVHGIVHRTTGLVHKDQWTDKDVLF